METFPVSCHDLPPIMDDSNKLVEQRRQKLQALRENGLDPFQNNFDPSEKCSDVKDDYEEGKEVKIAGRVIAQRVMGKSMFVHLSDQSGKAQFYASKNDLGDEDFATLKSVDLGDFIGVKGKLFTTKTGEKTIHTSEFVYLAKALRPPPEKFHGLVDTEIRYRQRYLDLIGNPEVKKIFLF